MKTRLTIALTFLKIITCNQLFAQCASNEGPGAPVNFAAVRVNSSGSSQVDQAVNLYYEALSKTFNVTCNVYYLPEERNSYANHAANDHNIYLGIPLVNAIFAQPNGQRMIAYLLAHEMAHLYQYKDAKNRFFSDNNYRNSFELQADYLAGYSLCHDGIAGSGFSRDLERTASDLGDYSFNRPTHHGTPFQRANAAALGATACTLSEIANVYDNSFYYINPGTLIKPFNDKQIMGEFYLFKAGRELFKGHERIYYNENDELFFKDGSEYSKIGAGNRIPDSYSSYRFELSYNDQVIYLKKTDYGKLLDNSGNVIGEFIFYSQYFSKGGPMTLTTSVSDPVKLDETSSLPPALMTSSGRIYLAIVGTEGKVTIKSSNDGVTFSTYGVTPFKVGNCPGISLYKHELYLSWLDSTRHPVIAKTPDGITWHSTRIDNLTGVERVSMAVFNRKLCIVWKDDGQHINVMTTNDGNSFSNTLLHDQSKTAPYPVVFNDDLCIVGTEPDSGKPYSLQSNDATEFFNHQPISDLEPNRAIAVSTHPVPEVMMIEQWFAWRSSVDGFINISNQFSGPNRIIVKEACKTRVAMAFPYFAWTDANAPYQVKIAKLLQRQ